MSGFATIDVGPDNMGLCIVRGPLNTEIPHFEKSTILISQKGYECKKYEEHKVAQLTIQWLNERRNEWASIKNGFVVIEKMMVPQKRTQTFASTSQAQRACLCIEIVMRTWFWDNFQRGGPIPIVVSPKWWQKEVGFKVGEFGFMGDEAAYRARKNRSLLAFFGSELFKNHVGLREIMYQRFGHKVDDIAESYLIAVAVWKNRQQLMQDALTELTYTHRLTLTLSKEFAVTAMTKFSFPTLEEYRRFLIKRSEPTLKPEVETDLHWKRLDQRKSQEKHDTVLHIETFMSKGKRRRPSYKTKTPNKRQKSKA